MPVFWIGRFIRHQIFLKSLGNPTIKPNPIFLPVQFVGRLTDYGRKVFRAQFIEYALSKYHRYLRHHYGPHGLGYFSYTTLSEAERRALYGQPRGRIDLFIDRFGDLLGYRDGDTFLDVGCGRGQNIARLVDRFPSSAITGLDVNQDALQIVRDFCESKNVSTHIADMTAADPLSAFETGSRDHVFMSHVFSIIIGEGLDETRRVRRGIVDEMLRVARRSVLIVDSPAVVADAADFEIEQSHRGVFLEDCSIYFADAGGRLVILKSGDSVGLLFQKA